MMQYRYAARTAAGQRVRGAVRAPDREAAIAGLHGRARVVTAVERERPWNVELRLPWRAGASPGRARVAFFRSFSTLIRAGIAMRRALQVTIERTADVRLRASLREVLGEIERGESLSAALGRRPRFFPALIVAMIAAGEAGGILDEVLERVATLLERDEQLRKSVVAALAYPATVLAASLALVVFLIVRIVPMFADLFASFHVDLPVSTRVLLWLGTAFGRPLPWIVAAVAASAGALALARLRRTQGGAVLLDRGRLAIPFAGRLIRTSIHARFARMLATLVRSGVELARALDVVTPVTGSPLHEAALSGVAIALREGEALAPPLAAARVFDPMLISLVGVGEETGMLDVMLEKAADYFESDVAAAIATLGAAIEPVLIIGLGGIVGLIVYSVYIPLYSLIGSISK
jgi:type IV pilus assembly protein PilC